MRKLLFVLLFAALILPACSGSSTETPTAQPLPRATITPLPDRPTPSAQELDLSDPTKPIEVNVGKDFTITVRTLPDQNYHWEIAEALDASLIEYVWKDHIPDHPNQPTSRGKDIWRFKALAPGQTVISLGYYEGQTVQTLQRLAFNVVVK